MSANSVSRRRFLQVSAGVAGAAGLSSVGLTACSSSGAKSDPKKLTLATTSDLVDMLKAPLAQFKKQNGITVTLRLMPSDTGTYFDAMRTQFQARSSDIDVIAGDVSWPAQFAANGWLADLTSRFTPALREPFLPATVTANTYQGGIYGVPFYTDAGFLYYRKDLLEKAGYSKPPQTWDELEAMAKKVMADSKIANGYVFQGARYEGGTLNGMEFIRTSGGDVLDGNNVVIGEPKAVRGLQIQRSLITSGVSPAGVAEYKEDESGGAFLGGKSVFLRSWGYLYGAASDKEQSKLSPEQVGVASVPRADVGIAPVNVGGGWSLYLNARSQKHDAAWELMKFIAAAPQQRIWATAGGLLPTLSALYDDAALVKALPVIAAGKAITAQTTTPPVSRYYADMSLAMAKHFNASLRGAVSPQQATEALSKQLASIVSHSN
ncbi:MAG: ABC transporter substrate-binding protein [Pseudonocardiales bacterium]|nr:MAG: ABC transporter substrate-binding protein [Pseudonocardiales bacterium]